MPTESPVTLVQRATANRPLLGITILLVEDSRSASEAMRMLALRSGARLRRADCLTSARRHMRLYRPSVVVVDVGLPDGSGLDLIREISQMRPRVQMIVGTSGDDMMHSAAIKAGADQFMPKPYGSMVKFQQMILQGFPKNNASIKPRLVQDDAIDPDPVIYRQDLVHAQTLLGQNPNSAMKQYLRQFVLGVATDVGDEQMIRAAKQADFPKIRQLLQNRIETIQGI